MNSAEGAMLTPNLLEREGDARLYPNFLSFSESNRLQATLTNTSVWKQENIVLFGKKVLQPRKTALYGDAGKSYRYSGITVEPLPWTPPLLEIRAKIEKHFGLRFNTVLLNLYRDGSDSMGWHRDDEKELGPKPVIASVSLGATRALKFRNRNDPSLKSSVDLSHGSLLLMSGETQHQWYHAIMKTKRPLAPRINLTFRRIL